MKQKEKDGKRRKISEGAASGATAIIFAIIGFQAAIVATRLFEPRPGPEPQTQTQTQITESQVREPQVAESRVSKRIASAPGRTASAVRAHSRPARKVESFRFDPNTVPLEDLVRLGLSERQAGAILNYREKGGKFRCREDFRKMYTVSDSLYRRLEEYIDIPKVELNAADSAQLVSLKGIGPYYAKRIIEYRNALGGFYDAEQLLEIRGMDTLRFEGLRESVCVDTCRIMKFSLDSVPEERLAGHPYFGKNVARAICRLRGIEVISATLLLEENILEHTAMNRIEKYVIFLKK